MRQHAADHLMERRLLVAGVAATLVVAAAVAAYRPGLLTMFKGPPQPSGTDDAQPSVEWRIAVVGAGFASEQQFDVVAKTFIDTVLENKTFAEYQAPVHFVKLSWDARIQTAVKPDGMKCGFVRDEDFGKAIGHSFKVHPVPGLTSIVVLNNAEELDACTAGELLISNRHSYKSAAHELGHMIGGLFDEQDGSGNWPKEVLGPNCTSDPVNLPWVPGAENPVLLEGCWYYHNLWRPNAACIMKDPKEREFCPACAGRLKAVLSQPNIAVPVPATAEYTQFIIQVRVGWSSRVNSQTFTSQMPPQVTRGPIAAGAIQGSRECLGGSFSALTTSSFPGGTEAPSEPLGDGSGSSIFVVVNCPGRVPDSQFDQLEFVSLVPGRNTWLTNAMFRAGHNTDQGKKVLDVR
jgi:hypothetical protein